MRQAYVSVAILTVLLLAQPQARADDKECPVKNIGVLLDNDWVDTQKVERKRYSPATREYLGTESFRWTNAFSFRRGQSWDRGTFWNVGGYTDYEGRLANGTAVSFNGKVYHDAFKGVYNLSLDPNDSDILLVRVAFTKRYVVKNKGDGEPTELEWDLDATFEPVGCVIEVPLDDGRIPEKKISITGKNPFFVDARGMEVTKRSEPYTILERLTGLGEKRTLDKRSFRVFPLEESLKCVKSDLRDGVYGKYPPPTFKPLRKE